MGCFSHFQSIQLSVPGKIICDGAVKPDYCEAWGEVVHDECAYELFDHLSADTTDDEIGCVRTLRLIWWPIVNLRLTC